jgi:hypothetical protein
VIGIEALVGGGTAAGTGSAIGAGTVIAGGIALNMVPNPTANGGNAIGSAPYRKFDENEALNFVPEPFGGDGYCLRLKWAINVLRSMSAWRASDLNPLSDSYSGHLRRLARVNSTLQRLEDHYRIVCGGDCPVE